AHTRLLLISTRLRLSPLGGPLEIRRAAEAGSGVERMVRAGARSPIGRRPDAAAWRWTVSWDQEVMLMRTDKRTPEFFEDPPLARVVFSSARFSWLWLIIRVWLGYNWVEASVSHKIGNPAWVTTGAAIKGFWKHAIAVPAGGKPPIAYDWYRDFL